MSASSNAVTPRQPPSSADWIRFRPKITELYQVRLWSMDKVAHYLESKGYRVNERMVRARISQWGLQRNHQLRDMVAALRLLDPDPAMWPAQPRFRIRGQAVTLGEVLHFFKRKKIPDPSRWVWSQPVDQSRSGVTLISGQSDSDELNDTTTSSGDQIATNEGCSSIVIQTHEDRAVASLRYYCSAYLGSSSANHEEPAIHRSTTHGRFGGHMQEGLAQLVRGLPNAWLEFDQGFDSVRPLLKECHPMALAQILTVSCNLAINGERSQPVLRSLLQHLSEMASELNMSGSVVQFLSALQYSQNISLVVISSLRAAFGAFTAHEKPCWQGFYIQERLSDCLVYCNERFEAASCRASLYASQEKVYGPFAQNIFRTLNSVAMDHLHAGNLDMATTYHTTVLARAQYLQEPGASQIRFVAFEGLAKIEQRRSEELSLNDAFLPAAIISYLRAFYHISNAVSEATKCARLSGQRFARAKDRQRHLYGRLIVINQQHLTQELRETVRIALYSIAV